jgi:hypothetical protein
MRWITKDGRHLSLTCMTCEHLRNSVNKILREGWRPNWLSAILAEIDRRCKPKVEKKEDLKEEETV